MAPAAATTTPKANVAPPTADASITTWGSCARDDPHYAFPGSGFGFTLGLAAISRPAETANIGDDFTIIRKSGASPGGIRISTAFGCEARYLHTGGGNYCFLDGHAKYVVGNIEKYITQAPTDGCWYAKWLTFDR